jgi:hypothetical protein
VIQRMVKPNPQVFLVAVLLVVVSLACQTAVEPTATPVPPTPPSEAPTETSAVQPTTAPAEASTEAPTDAPTEAPTEAPTTPATSPPPPATVPPTVPGLAILSFTVDIEDIPTGKRLTFNWETTGAVRAMIWSGTSQRFPQMWEVPPNGTHTVELADTYYRNPLMGLMAYDEHDHEVSESVKVDWPCEHDYFFEPWFDACPYEGSSTWAAEQPFERGRMIWLEQVGSDDYVLQRQVLVFYADGKYAQYEDTWTSADPESDPALVPPDGLYQPTRGFGKVWREKPGVRDRLGWATVPEVGYEAAWQQQMRESIPSVAFVRTFDGRLIQINGWGWETGGDWMFVTP